MKNKKRDAIKVNEDRKENSLQEAKQKIELKICTCQHKLCPVCNRHSRSVCQRQRLSQFCSKAEHLKALPTDLLVEKLTQYGTFCIQIGYPLCLKHLALEASRLKNRLKREMGLGRIKQDSHSSTPSTLHFFIRKLCIIFLIIFVIDSA